MEQAHTRLIDQLNERIAAPDNTPLYLKFAETVKNAVRNGVLEHGNILPGERDLSQLTGVSRITVRKAMQALEAEGVVTRARGYGTQINNIFEYSLKEARGFSQQVVLRGKKPNTLWVNKRVVKCPEEVASQLSVPPESEVFLLKRIRYVDVRIIAATNQNLLEKVRQGLFREDLYYRLKIGYLYIPPLRKRKEDVPYLAQKLLLQNGGSGVSMTPELLRWMEKQPWNGNVRELKNLIIYMNALRTGNLLDMEDIPEGEYVHPPEISCNGTPHDPGDQLLVLIETLLSQNGLLGRRQLLEKAKASGICMTEYRLRKTLKMLEEDGKIIMGKGKVGIRLR